MRRFACIAVAAACLPASSCRRRRPDQADLGARLASALAVPHAGLTAALAVDLTTGETLFSRRERLALVPASNEKLAVTYAALAVLGPTFRIETTVLGEGELIDGVWHGDLVLRATATRRSRRGDLRALASQLRDGGVRRGHRQRASATSRSSTAAGVGPSWKPGFYINESPPLSALTVDRDLLPRDDEPGACAGGREPRSARRSWRPGSSVAGQAGTGRADGTAFALATVSSEPIAALVRRMNRESDNFMAELLLKQLGAVEARAGHDGARRAVVRAHAGRGRSVPLAGRADRRRQRTVSISTG